MIKVGGVDLFYFQGQVKIDEKAMFYYRTKIANIRTQNTSLHHQTTEGKRNFAL